MGLSCARAAALKGLRVLVVDRDAQANGASVRNFGFITVTGQERGTMWQRARRTRDIWEQVAQETGIPILQRGMWLTARRRESLPLLESFLTTEMAEGCELLSRAAAVVVCPGDDLTGLFQHRIAEYQVTRCKLQMLKLATPGFSLPAAVMSDLSLVRYAGFSALQEAAPLLARIEAEQAEYLRNGIHLIIVQDADGGLVIGDSHHYAATPDPFSVERVDRLLLDEFAAATGRSAPAILERWTGTYSSAAGRTMFIDAPTPRVRIVMVTCGSGASTGFAIGEEVIEELYG